MTKHQTPDSSISIIVSLTYFILALSFLIFQIKKLISTFSTKNKFIPKKKFLSELEETFPDEIFVKPHKYDDDFGDYEHDGSDGDYDGEYDGYETVAPRNIR